MGARNDYAFQEIGTGEVKDKEKTESYATRGIVSCEQLRGRDKVSRTCATLRDEVKEV